MDLLNYLKSHSIEENPCEDKLHLNLLEEILRNLDAIGISFPKHVFRNVHLTNDNSGGVNIVVIDKFGELYLIEATVARSKRKTGQSLRSALKIPLMRAYEFFVENFGIVGTKIGVYRLFGASRFESYRVQKDLTDLLSSDKKAE